MGRKSKKFRRRVHVHEKHSPIPLARIKVVGVGGGGGNAVARMSRNFIRGVEFMAINTDHQDLSHCEVRHKIYIGRNLTRGLGTGMNPDLGRQAAEENRSEIAEAVKDADIVFITAGFGGGTGTGVSPIVAEAAKQGGALTLAFVTKPFAFEGSQRQRIAEEGIQKIKDKVDALVIVPNDRIFSVISKETPVMKAFEAIDDVMRNALEGLVELIITPGIINVDFADVRSVIQDAGSAIVGVGVASGQERAAQAVNQALNSPLLDVNPDGARGVLLGIAGGRDMRMSEINEAAKLVSQMADPGAKIIFGAYYDRHLKPKQFKVTLVATGFSGPIGGAASLFGGGFVSDNRPAYLGGAVKEIREREESKAKTARDKDRAEEDMTAKL
ncbi:MAG: cell division protein FtsZ, partial [Patescibacteria group bacterium]